MASGPALVVRAAANLSELKKGLSDGRIEIEKTTAGMQKLANGLSGEKLTQKAQNIVGAVNQIGGATKLTDGELKRYGKTLDDAIAKLQRMGKEAPASMQSLQKEINTLRVNTDQATQKTSLFDGAVQSLGPKLLGAFSVGAVLNFAKGIVTTAGEIDDMAKRLDISAVAAQQFRHAAELGGATLEDVGKAIRFASDNLGGNNAGFNAALERAGLNASTLKAMKPEDVFLAITDAIKQIEDPFVRANVAQDLFGKNASTLMPAIRDGFREVGAAAAVMSDEAVSAFDYIGDKMGEFGPYMKAQLANFLTEPWTEYRRLMRDLKNEIPESFAAMAAPELFSQTVPAIGATGEALDKLTKAQEEMNRETERSIKEAKAYSDRIKALGDSFSGAALQDRVRDITLAFERLTPAQRADAEVMARVSQEVDKLAKAGATLSPTLQRVWLDTQRWNAELNAAWFALDRLEQETRAYDTILGFVNRGVTGVTSAEQQRMTGLANTVIRQGAQNQALADYNVYLTDQAYRQSIANAELENAQRPMQAMTGLAKTMTDALTGGFVQILSGARSFKEGMIATFESMITQILGDFTNRFLQGMLNAITGAEGGFSAAFRDLFGGGKDGGGMGKFFSQFGRNAGNGWVSGILSVLQSAGTAYAIYSAFTWIGRLIGGGESPERRPREIGAIQNPDGSLTPVYGTGIEQDEYERRYGDGSDPRGPEFDQGQNTPNFDQGTLGRYGQFGAGTPAMLHGTEAVVPRGATPTLAADIANLLRQQAPMNPEAIADAIARRLERTLPLAMSVAVRDAALLSRR